MFGRRRDRHAVGSVKGIYEQEKIPTEWRDSVIIPIYKEKGDIQDCGNYRGIKLMSHTMKIWERIIDRRLREETTIGDEQFGFMPGRGTTDAIFAVRQLRRHQFNFSDYGPADVVFGKMEIKIKL